jgi:hypothetical protein
MPSGGSAIKSCLFCACDQFRSRRLAHTQATDCEEPRRQWESGSKRLSGFIRGEQRLLTDIVEFARIGYAQAQEVCDYRADLTEQAAKGVSVARLRALNQPAAAAVLSGHARHCLHFRSPGIVAHVTTLRVRSGDYFSESA